MELLPGHSAFRSLLSRLKVFVGVSGRDTTAENQEIGDDNYAKTS
jgi:hypothetical protein